jgi:sulfite exporter TauE/SafE
MNWILAGLAFGFFGSVHCMGMCGPLALSLPGGDQLPGRFLLDRLIYNLGRAATYTGLGALVGAAGHAVALAGAQQAFSIWIGTIMILAAVVPWVSRQVRRLEQVPSAFLSRVTKPMGRLYHSSGLGAMLVTGLLNGLLPYGFVYAALATALTAGGVAGSMTFMAGFGLGSLPAMLAVSLLGRLAGTAWRTRLQRLVPVGLALVGLLLIVRGLGLGSMLSPLLSPPALLSPLF